MGKFEKLRVVAILALITIILLPFDSWKTSALGANFVPSSPSFQWFPAVSGNRIVWVDNRAGNLDIYLYDLSTNKEMAVCTNSADQYMPKIYGDRVVWMDKRAMSGKEEKWDIYMFDLKTGQEIPICTSPGSHKSPSIWKDYIVWQDERNGNADIYLYDLNKGEERPISLSPGNQMYPSIDGDRIVWLDGRENFNFTDIYMYDLTLEKEIPVWVHNPNKPEAAGVPDIFGDKIVWSLNHEDGTAALYMYTIPTKQTSIIVREEGSRTNRSCIYWPRIWGNWIVYTLYKDGIRQVNVFDLNTGEKFIPSKSVTGQDAPAIWGNLLVWQDKVGTLERIAWMELSPIGAQSGQSAPFFDIAEHWSYPYVLALYQRGIVKGLDDGTFRPDSFLTRAQFATLLASSFSLQPGESRSFPDVSPDAWYAQAVQVCAQSGWMIGFEDGRFYPDDKITKAQAIVALSRAAGLEKKEGNLPFSDTEGHWSEPFLKAFFLSDPPFVESRLFRYFSRGENFEPNQFITRGQVSLFLASLLRLPLSP
ncbi:MAG: S-layer homology domain-containing protein [Caldiserica bacterium]|nr:S-layer homology domain-containing protein [Caldisericota bacterium]MDH7563031.1 S-layer homology domain-containing protein [Caldisericota bacterium]